ncbi:MAG: 3'(2'),5'-bisphosphate nucleotidase CysQ [Gammaproteobacteria bacterium]|nr:3'(2'),5'-bisphosphate nucleotidase CysQ [Gammaproteobacteria bacterium]
MKIDERLVGEVIRIAKMAGQELLDIYNAQSPLDIRTKQDNSPVTLADLRAHDIILKNLSLLTPEVPLLSEEDPDFSFDIRKTWSQYWLVDPLDGTREFIERSGQFTVNIALIENSVPVLGVIFVPLKNLLYFAAKGLGSFKAEGEGEAIALSIREWHPGDEIVLVATRRELHEELQGLLLAQGNLKLTYRSSSLKFCMIAEGLGDIYLRKARIHEWDTGAGQCIVEQASGVVLDLNWEALRYNTRSHLLNPPFIAVGDSKQLLPLLKLMPMFKEIN